MVISKYYHQHPSNICLKLFQYLMFKIRECNGNMLVYHVFHRKFLIPIYTWKGWRKYKRQSVLSKKRYIIYHRSFILTVSGMLKTGSAWRGSWVLYVFVPYKNKNSPNYPWRKKRFCSQFPNWKVLQRDKGWKKKIGYDRTVDWKIDDNIIDKVIFSNPQRIFFRDS